VYSVFVLLFLLYCFIFIFVLLLCYVSRSSLYCNIPSDLCTLCLYCYYFSFEHEIKNTTDTDRSASYLDLHLEIDSERRIRKKLYDKKDDFNFLIVNFPFICSNIPAAPAYGVYIYQFMRYSRACCSYQDFLDRGLLLTKKLLYQGFLLVKLNSSVPKCYGRHHDLVDRYGKSVS
jgi:hypothetical protein